MKLPDFRSSIGPSYDGVVIITVVLAPEGEDDGKHLQDLIEGLVLLAHRGAFVRTQFHPAEAEANILERRHAPPVKFEWRVNVRKLDHRFAQVLRNQLVMFTKVLCQVTRASLTMETPPQPTPATVLPALTVKDVEDGNTYPGLSSTLGFGVRSMDVSDLKRNRRAEVQFRQSFDDEQLEAIREWFDAWVPTLDRAFAYDEGVLWRGRNEIDGVVTDILDTHTMETQIEIFNAPEVAWLSYINLAGRLGHELLPIAEVRVY